MVIDFYSQVSHNKKMTYVLFFLFFCLIGGLSLIFSFILELYAGGGFFYFLTFFGFLTIIFAVVGYYFSDSIVTSISGAKQVEKKDNPKLFNLVEEMSIASGLPMPRIFVIDDSAINAFATGRNPATAVICFTTGCLTRLNRDQLQGVAAHELSHIKNYDIRTMTLATVLVGVSVLLSDLIIRMIIYAPRNSSNNDSKNAGMLYVVLIVVGILLAILTPIIAELIKLCVSRKREYLADASAVEMTRNPEGLASALEVISKDTEPLEAANKATAHLYISNPLKGQKLFMASLFSTHPPIEDRIKILRGQK
ncbi:MAG: M48 family metallopeptidase [Candidatus ainarchaeum sp.]|nr:M48 family metallopeptidase [Candidatus ainarchaeum sp.]